ncbi:Uncharacterised protein [Corynebacterium jeikeium]|uniref:Uncharacterized protein n=2 Tax=Corynebacterium jeikeium TaxID=38289 RepID=Q4JVT8_CORJK|nr:hypothetical protein jk0905 [Corynebacterium jeikeium K411]SUY85567.1 Uncharacterised protein [Corynebacterium jeikeium]
MAKGTEVVFLGRAVGSSLGCGAPVPDCLIFMTPQRTHILPIWVEPTLDLGGRPTDAEVLANILKHDEARDPWFARIVTNSRGQMTAGLVLEEGESERFIDIRPSILEPLWHAGVIFDVRVDPGVESALIRVNPAWVDELEAKLKQVDEDGDQVDFLLDWNPEDMGFTVSDNADSDFQQMWEGLGLSSDLDDWLKE